MNLMNPALCFLKSTATLSPYLVAQNSRSYSSPICSSSAATTSTKVLLHARGMVHSDQVSTTKISFGARKEIHTSRTLALFHYEVW